MTRIPSTRGQKLSFRLGGAHSVGMIPGVFRSRSLATPEYKCVVRVITPLCQVEKMVTQKGHVTHLNKTTERHTWGDPTLFAGLAAGTLRTLTRKRLVIGQTGPERMGELSAQKSYLSSLGPL